MFDRGLGSVVRFGRTSAYTAGDIFARSAKRRAKWRCAARSSYCPALLVLAIELAPLVFTGADVCNLSPMGCCGQVSSGPLELSGAVQMPVAPVSADPVPSTANGIVPGAGASHNSGVGGTGLREKLINDDGI